MLDGIVWKFRTGTAWQDVPERCGPWDTLHTRFRRWALGGTFERMLQAAQASADVAGGIDWLVPVDSTAVRAYQHAAGARKGSSAPGTGTLPRRPDQQDSLGLRCLGRPLAFTVTGGNAGDCIQFTAVMDTTRVPALDRAGPASGPTR